MAVPFYLAHPRLEKLEQRADAGGRGRRARVVHAHPAPRGRARRSTTPTSCASGRSGAKLFGKSSEPYPEFYTPKPYSKSFVLHLDPWYAQSHPDEDFAETFAVWLTPAVELAQRYAGWPALKKLEYMDALMRSLAGQPPKVATGDEVEPLAGHRETLRAYYRRKRRHYGVDHPAFYDRDLRRLFSDAPEHARPADRGAVHPARTGAPSAGSSPSWTGIYQYTIDQVIEDMIARCRELKLRLAVPEDQARHEFTVLLTVQMMNYLHSGRHRIAL